jgi:hypothetical protein
MVHLASRSAARVPTEHSLITASYEQELHERATERHSTTDPLQS